jgi:hypothetical protein
MIPGLGVRVTVLLEMSREEGLTLLGFFVGWVCCGVGISLMKRR